MIVSADNIEDYIPQRSPIVMVGEILENETDRVLVGFNIHADNIFLEDGRFTESGLMENMAQAAACKVGFEYKAKNEPVPLGFIGAISKVRMHHRPLIGSYIKTAVTFGKTVFNVSLIEAKTYCDDVLLCECKMKIVLQNPSK